ncbi:MAG TPA: hypothetical protein VFV47_09955 [Hyphomicrobiaceae bacterium]|nr:hypothetical protein [Hyphomicrobiaceae bacterium]
MSSKSRMLALVGAGLLAALAPNASQAQAPPQESVSSPVAGGRVETLMREGWEIAGFVAASDIRTLILLRHGSHPWLVQCSVLIDVTRSPRQIVACYEIR